MADKLLSKKEAAEMLGVSMDTIDRLVMAGEIPMYRISTVVRFWESEVVAYVLRHQVRPSDPPPRRTRQRKGTEPVIHYVMRQIVV